MKIILLGAGASKAYSASVTNVKMPIAKDFFPTFSKLSISENGWVLVGGLINYLKIYKHIKTDEEFGKLDMDIEILHSEIEQRLNDLLKSEEETEQIFSDINLCFKAYTQLIYLFTSVINEIQNGPVSNSHVNLVKLLTAEDVIITFNWDTLVDRALSTEKKWNCFSGYFVKPVSVYQDKWNYMETNRMASNAPLLLKLHGSSNWLTSAPIVEGKEWKSIQEVSTDNFCVYESNLAPYHTYDGRYMKGYEDFSYGYYPVNLPMEGIPLPKGHLLTRTILRTGNNPKGESEDHGLTSIPLIIPPVKNKTYDYYGTLFTSLWEKAQQAITNASQIVIIGYSFPETDYKSDQLFRRAFSDRNDFPEIVVIDPFPEKIVERFTLDLGIPIEKIKVVREYFSEAFDLSTILLK